MLVRRYFRILNHDENRVFRAVFVVSASVAEVLRQKKLLLRYRHVAAVSICCGAFIFSNIIALGRAIVLFGKSI